MRDLKSKQINPGDIYHNWVVIERTSPPDHIKNKANSFWICKCNCGNLRTLTGGHLRASNSKGCKACSMISKRKEKGECSFNGLYLRYKHGAIDRKKLFNLDKEQFKKLTLQNCFYCGIPPSSCHKGKTA